MLLDFDFIHLDIYNGRSNLLIILHAILSALVGFSFLSLDPKRRRLEILVGIAVSIMLAGMFSAVLNLRVYGSVLMNAFAYIFFFAALRFYYDREEIEIDCYGDRAKVQEYKSTFFKDE